MRERGHFAIFVVAKPTCLEKFIALLPLTLH